MESDTSLSSQQNMIKMNSSYNRYTITRKSEERKLNNRNQLERMLFEIRIEPETSTLLDGSSTIRAISVRLFSRYIPALYVLVLHPILHNADLKDERKFLLLGVNIKFYKTMLFYRNILICPHLKYSETLLLYIS